MDTDVVVAQVIFEDVYKSFPARKGDRTANPTSVDPSLSSTTSTQPKSKDDTKSDTVTILRHINFSVEDGEFMVLVGPSGCGKSTLLRLIAGLEDLTGGSIRIGDRKINHLPPKARDIAMVFQSYALYPHMSVYNNLAFGLRRTQSQRDPKRHSISASLRRKLESGLVSATRILPKPFRYRSKREKLIEQTVHQVAEILQIETLLDRLPKQLSGGQKQRVALGRAMARDPQVFLMDEPLSNLDAKLRTQTRAQIVKLQRQLGTTTVYVTHDQTEAMTMGDRIAVMNAGQIQQIASPLELYNQPINRFVAQFIGSPPMNFISVQVRSSRSLQHPQFTLTLPEVWEMVLQNYQGQTLTLGIRPEHLDLASPNSSNIPTQVELVEALGHETYLSLQLTQNSQMAHAPAPLIARINPYQQVSLGEQLWFSVQLDKIHLFDQQTEAAIRPSHLPAPTH
ncbi:ABC transporter ATP-binding protein [Acaryochloris marina]|uniref:Sugar ABC transporter, ATP-binding protein, putative n=1 Tax=Acaryochloris marina (strain MBIC 11017) TaxID=329726 RepID=B0CBS5_ACAM1|nr:ATP-binding cassette domain-containing protein [Acaryochloris marina]ABW30325.1 sugar ABC transporter, ATP-binding protein, putative [Acaryochloris marina MBIC11017]BDM79148.1 sugar ABC transporter ATP-binding protein [Acaryochloris marina MBIC10699]